MMEQLKLEARELRKFFRSREVVKSVSFDVSQGEVVGLLGPNGAGKTTSFYMIVGLLFPNEGQVLLGGQDITSQPM
ncbi:MAG: ATP-binding cassette domain-containing protein, partial [Oligoflexus sp.]